MGVRPQKDPRYKPVPGKLKRWLDTQTGAILTRSQFEKATAHVSKPGNTTGSTLLHRKTYAAQVGSVESAAEAAAGSTVVESAVSGPTPIVEPPEPPPIVAAAYDVTKEAADVAHAASAGIDRLATKIGQGIAQCASYAAEAFLPAHRAYWAPPEAALRQVTEPAARLVARHSHLSVDLGPDGDDIGDLFVGVMACITAISVQKIQYENAKLQYIHEFEVKNGPGSYQAAVAASRGAAPSGTQNTGQAAAPVRHEGAAGSGANGATADSGAGAGSERGVLTITDELIRSHANGHRERRSL